MTIFAIQEMLMLKLLIYYVIVPNMRVRSREERTDVKSTLLCDYETTSLPSLVGPKIYVVAIKSPRLNKHLHGCGL